MTQVPITNDGKDMRFIPLQGGGSVALAPGETRVFEAAELPPHLRPERSKPAPLPTEPEDRLLELLDQNVDTIVKAVEERGDGGRPVLSDDELIRLAEAEANGKTRSTLMKALDAERMNRADESKQREDLAVFAASLEDMSDEQLTELAKTHQQDPAKLGAVQMEQFSRQVNQAAEAGDREMLELLRGEIPGAVEVPAAVELIDAALAKLGEGE